MPRPTPTIEEALVSDWYAPNEAQGLCECGCGANAPIASRTDRRAGQLKGQPTRFICGHSARNRRRSEAHRKAIGLASSQRLREKNPGWRGDEASYNAIHRWRQRNCPKSGECAHCNKRQKTHWANISGEYRREDETDWLELCEDCHNKYDAEKRGSSNASI